MWSESFFLPHSSGDSLGILEMFMIECLNSWISSKCRLEWVCGTWAGAFQSLCLCSHRGSAVTLLSAEPQQNAALMSELKTGILAFLSGECCWMFSSLRRCFQPSKQKREKKTASGFESRSHLSLAYWCLPLGRVGLMTAWKRFQMLPALFTQSRLPESLVWLRIDHWIVTNDSSGLEVFFFLNGCYESRALEPDSCGSLFPLKTDSPRL